MIHMKPSPAVSEFNILLAALAKNKHYYYVISLCAKMGSVGLRRDFLTLNVLMSCFCSVKTVSNGLWLWAVFSEMA